MLFDSIIKLWNIRISKNIIHYCLKFFESFVSMFTFVSSQKSIVFVLFVVSVAIMVVFNSAAFHVCRFMSMDAAYAVAANSKAAAAFAAAPIPLPSSSRVHVVHDYEIVAATAVVVVRVFQQRQRSCCRYGSSMDLN